ncbi:hypothetical protein AAU61_11880 [Desulfocarbo indianensis]|nr:hypothetical protein AAU61_11880 [Desulfocarbo indianensis]
MPEELASLAGLVKSAPFLESVLDCMPELVCVLTGTRQLVMANQAMLAFLGRQEGDLIPGARPGELLQCVHAGASPHGCGTTPYCSQCGAFGAIMASIGTGARASGECRVTQSKSGRNESLDLYLWCSPFSVEGLEFYVLAILDISDQKRRQALERIFFHDLLNSFSALSSQVQLLQNARSEHVPQLSTRLSLAADALLQEILAQRDLLLAESNRLKPNPSLINPAQVAQRVVEAFQSDNLCRDRLLQIAPQSQSIGLISDAVLLNRVLVNMVKNALEASQAGDMVVIGWEHTEGQIEIWVHNPQVIPHEHQLQVFNRSFSTKGSGRGLGTYSIRLLSERYLEGEAGFTSTQETGTRFYVRLPLRPSYFPQKPA